MIEKFFRVKKKESSTKTDPLFHGPRIALTSRAAGLSLLPTPEIRNQKAQAHRDEGMLLSWLLSRLAVNGFRYRYLKMTGGASKPEALSLEITRRCLAHCIMCNIWKTPPDLPELKVSEWTKVLSSPILTQLKELDITGGEPFLRRDLLELLEGICGLKGSHYQALRSVAITTNGFLPLKIMEVVREAVPRMKEKNIDLVIACGLDALGELHDKIRNFEGGWRKLEESIQGLLEIRGTHKNLVVGLKTTILPDNVDRLEDIAEYAEEKGLFLIISPYILTDNRFDNFDRQERLQFHPGDIQKMIRFYEGGRFQWDYHRQAIIRFLKDGIMIKPCSAGFNYFYVRSTGDVFPCPIINLKLGNFVENSFENLIRSSTAKYFRKKIGKFPECRSCTEPGLERYSLAFEGLKYLSYCLKKGKRDFLRLHSHMGIDKYF